MKKNLCISGRFLAKKWIKNKNILQISEVRACCWQLRKTGVGCCLLHHERYRIFLHQRHLHPLLQTWLSTLSRLYADLVGPRPGSPCKYRVTIKCYYAVPGSEVEKACCFVLIWLTLECSDKKGWWYVMYYCTKQATIRTNFCES